VFLRIAVLSIAFAFVATFYAAAAPSSTPVPGGANQIDALSGTIGQTVFNGVLRIDVQQFRPATDADDPGRINPGSNQKVLVMNVLVRNGSHRTFIGALDYMLADKDDVTYHIGGSYIEGVDMSIVQGGSARNKAMFPVDKDFVPTKLIVQCLGCGKSVRFTIPYKEQSP
jgi:hypothetical protein